MLIAADAAKAAALTAAASVVVPEPALIALQSDGVLLIYGQDDAAIETGRALAAYLDVTVLLRPGSAVAIPHGCDFPIANGKVRSAKGQLGSFQLTVDAFQLTGSAPERDGMVSHCDVILDLSGGAPLFPPGLRDGYLRADPGSPEALRAAVLQAKQLRGIFDKPRYVETDAHLCAHSRSGIIGCRRCLDLCPANAITPAGDYVTVDPAICAGCGQCASACPTGAISYAVPPAYALTRRLRALLLSYADAGGINAAVLLHDELHGAPLIDALGNDVPVCVLPLVVNEITQVGIELVAAAFAYGASSVHLLARSRPRHSMAGLEQTVALADALLCGLGFGAGRVTLLGADDPDLLLTALAAIPAMPASATRSRFMPMESGKRELMRFALRELYRAAPTPADIVPLPPGAPFGAVEVATDGCTLCLACTSACPTAALSANPERPQLRFTESACVQCGLCTATCPEHVITLKPQIDFRTTASDSRVLKQEEPFPCLRCGKPFGVASAVERVTAKLRDHWMYRDQPWRLNLIRMCDTCRVAEVAGVEFDPYSKPRSPVRTAADYAARRAAGEDP